MAIDPITTSYVVAQGGANLLLKYSKEQYDIKIDKLANCEQSLESHLGTLESLKSRINEFWNDAEAERYMKIITNEIVKIRGAKERVNRLKNMYTEISSELQASTVGVTTVLETAQAALDKIGD